MRGAHRRISDRLNQQVPEQGLVKVYCQGRSAAPELDSSGRTQHQFGMWRCVMGRQSGSCQPDRQTRLHEVAAASALDSSG